MAIESKWLLPCVASSLLMLGIAARGGEHGKTGDSDSGDKPKASAVQRSSESKAKSKKDKDDDDE